MQFFFKHRLKKFPSCTILNRRTEETTHKTNESVRQMEKEKKLVNVAVLREQRPQIRKLAEKSGKKVYALIGEAVNLWAKQNGYES